MSKSPEIPKWVIPVIVLVVGVILGLILWSIGTGYWLEAIWFGTLGYASVFWRILGWKWFLGLVGSIATLIWLAANAKIVGRLAPKMPEDAESWEIKNWSDNTLITTWITRILVFLISTLAFGLWAASLWDEVLRYSFRVPFGQTDPVFGLDLGFYIFSMPVYGAVTSWILTLFFITAVMLGILSLVFYERTKDLLGRQAANLFWHKEASSHIAIVLGLMAFVFAVRSYLARYALVYSPVGVVVGAGYTDIHARIPAYIICAWIGGFLGLAFLASAIRHSWKPAAWVAGIWIVAHLLVLWIYPGCVQLFSVRPNEFAREAPYIARNIAFTREAFALDVEGKQFPAEETLTLAQIEANPKTIQNIRLWDYRPLLNTLKQEQELRLYYEFVDTDIDRYRFGDQYRQVMLAPRELSQAELPQKAKQWVPQRLQYTHGYGLCLTPVNEITLEGRPRLWIKGMPVETTISDFPEVTQPRIYYGELTNYRVYVNTGIPEIDYPIEEGFAETRYRGTGGITIGSGLRKFILAWKFDFFKILLSKYIQTESKVLWRRDIDERIRTIAPFLRYDHDPYMVVGEDGRLWWIRDAYTAASTFPYSERYYAEGEEEHEGKPTPTASLEGCNYVRNSVKVVVDAYNGSVIFYVMDPTDPIIATYSKIFPALFKPLDEMPQDVRAHIRYPETLFLVQAEIYTDYHMSETRVFYTREDKWHIALEIYRDPAHKQRVEPYYIVMKLPGEEQEEFLLMLPFTPKKKPNMIAWMAARCDEPNYGQLQVFLFPKGKLVHGTMQVENRIDQDEEISARLTLWGQRGSEVIRGNLMVIPIEQSLLYVEPLYLQAEAARYPELKKVLVATHNRLVMADTLDDALRRLFELAPEAAEVPAGEEGRTVSELISSAARHLSKAGEYAGRGEWQRQGAELQALKRNLDELLERVR